MQCAVQGENDFKKGVIVHFHYIYANTDCLCGLVVGVSGCGCIGPGFDSRRCQVFWVAVGLERGPLGLVRLIEELLE